MVQFSINERTFGGKVFRPRPEIYISDAQDLLIIATPWGPRASARRAIDRMLEYIDLARDDREATSPFERLTCLSPMNNTLRISTFLANDLVFGDENKDEYRAGVEVVALATAGDEVSWLQIGNPQIYISRLNRPPICLASAVDLSFDLSARSTLPPLPGQMLGLDASVNVNTNSFKAHPNDLLVLLSHSYPPASIVNAKTLDLLDLTRQISAEDAETPFWIGVVRLKIDSKSDDKGET